MVTGFPLLIVASVDPAPLVMAACLALLAHVGFALFTTGMCRAKNASTTISMSFMVLPLGIAGFYLCGFQLLYGHGPFLSGDRSIATLAVFLFMLVRMDVMATIPLGTLAERWSFRSFFFFSLLVGAIIFPVFGGWVWGGGWIARLGSNRGWGFGGMDYGGSAVIHLQGGMVALAGAIVLGPRLGKYDGRGKPRPILGHHLPMAMVGTLIISLGLTALNAGASLANDDGQVGLVVVNTIVAGAAGAIAACVYIWAAYKKPDPSIMCNGMLGGIVAVSAACAMVTPMIACVIGMIAGVLVAMSVFFLERRGLDDPVGAVSVHGVNGLWGILALGLFADGTYGRINAGHPGVMGLFYGDSRQLLCQGVLAIACCGWDFWAAFFFFGVIGKFVHANRVSREVELLGLDIPEMGVPGYPEVLNNPSGHGATGRAGMPEPRPASMPVGGERRFSLVVEGIPPDELIKIWSSLCQTGASPPTDEFKAIYPFVTTVTGNRFRFRGGNPATIKDNLAKLFQSADSKRPVRVIAES